MRPAINRTFRLLLLWILLAAVALPQGTDLDSQYIVRNIDGVVMLIDVENGWTWKRVTSTQGKPPRWLKVNRFKNAAEALAWVTKNPMGSVSATEDTQKWAAEVLLGFEFRPNGDAKPVIRRWVTSPTVSVFGSSLEHQKLVENAAQEINKALKPATRTRLKLVEPKDNNAAIRVHFLQYDQFPAFCAARNVPFAPGNFGCFFTKWDNKYRITDADVLIAVDKAYGDQLRHLVLEEVTQALGPMNDSPLKTDSLFFSGQSTFTKLSPDDRQLLSVLYRNLRPGDSQIRVNAAISRYWKAAPQTDQAEKP